MIRPFNVLLNPTTGFACQKLSGRRWRVGDNGELEIFDSEDKLLACFAAGMWVLIEDETERLKTLEELKQAGFPTRFFFRGDGQPEAAE